MPYIITLKEPIAAGLDTCEMNQISEIRTESVVADISVPEGLIMYRINGKYNYIPINNLLGTYYVKEGQAND